MASRNCRATHRRRKSRDARTSISRLHRLVRPGYARKESPYLSLYLIDVFNFGKNTIYSLDQFRKNVHSIFHILLVQSLVTFIFLSFHYVFLSLGFGFLFFLYMFACQVHRRVTFLFVCTSSPQKGYFFFSKKRKKVSSVAHPFDFTV